MAPVRRRGAFESVRLRGVVSAVVLMLLLLSLVGARPGGCRLDVRVDVDAPDLVVEGLAPVMDGLAARGVSVSTTRRQMVPSREKAFDPDRVRPLWLGRRDVVEVFVGTAGRENELGHAYLAAGEVVLVGRLLDDELFPSEELVLTEEKLDQLAAAWCGRPDLVV